MTKADLISGKVFKISNFSSEYQYTAMEDGGNGYLVKGFMSDGRFVNLGYHLNVDKIGSKTFEGSTFIIDKAVRRKVRFENCVLVEEEGVE